VPVRYVDLARRQLAELGGKTGQDDLDYWVGQLAGAPETLDLPLDHPRPQQSNGRGDTLVERWPPGLVAEVEAFRRRHGLTAFTVLLAAFDALLAARCGQDDVTVGVPVANRTRADSEVVVGFFVNMLPVRVDTAVARTFRDLLHLVREAVTGAQAHQDLPFDLLVQARAGSRGRGANPLFQVAFAVQEGDTEELVLDGLRVRRLVARTGTTKFDLTLTLTPVEDGMLALLEYDSDLFERATAADLLAELRAVVAAAIRDPDRPLIDLLPPSASRPVPGGVQR
jgi:non-ribosomal peptide synthetase component F